jgi:hypothetical protein
MARLYANENFPLASVHVLRALGHDVLTTAESAQDNRSIADSDVLAFATKQGRAIVTFNKRDFVRLHHSVATHSGIIVCSFDTNFTALAARIDAALKPLGALDNQLIRIHKPNLPEEAR